MVPASSRRCRSLKRAVRWIAQCIDGLLFLSLLGSTGIYRTLEIHLQQEILANATLLCLLFAVLAYVAIFLAKANNMLSDR